MADTPKIAPKLIATIDVALFTLVKGELCVALAKRDRKPEKGKLALIGGYVHTDEDEDTLETAKRVLMQKAGVTVTYLEQLYTFSGTKRDDRGWSISVAYVAVVPAKMLEGSTVFELVRLSEMPALPFDHNKIINVAAKRLRSKATYSSLPAFLLPEEFTMNELMEVYQQVIGVAFERSNFERRMMEQGIVELRPGRRIGHHRPAKLYSLAGANLTEFDRQIAST